MIMKRQFLAAAAVTCAGLVAGCAHAQGNDPRDPMEPFNRSVDAFNRSIDEAALQPVARAYERALPSPVRTGVSNFFANLGDAWSAANSVLQLKPVNAAHNGMRFAMNTLLGLGGTLDIATDAGIERHKEDFGTTLAHWGVPAGPYLVLPLLGPSTLRDMASMPVDFAGHPLAQVTPMATRNAIGAAGIVDLRARLLPLDAVAEQSLDRYMFMRDVYLQHRQAQVNRGPDEAGELAIEGQAHEEANP
ncbi:MAG: VacJ family lipoprotein [Ramlibacter sp.]|jgi:phospholipid-binding lipoprotein MlaA|nr:VacJ family lipoprotein [Ramlibacter sp.]